MKKLLILSAVLCRSLMANAMDAFYGDLNVTKGADYAFMQDNAKMWLYLDFTKAQLVNFDGTIKKWEIKEEKGLYLEQKNEEEWAEDFEAVYFWIVKYWNIACDKRNIPLHMTADKDSAKYAMEFYVNQFDYGWPRVGPMIPGEGATIVGTLLVRDLQTKETVYEAEIDRIRSAWGLTKEVWRIRNTIYGCILAPFFLGMDPWHIDVGDKATLMKYNKDYKPKKKK